MKWENSITVLCPIEEVFDFVTDADGGTEWHRTNQITPLSEGPIQVGSQFRVSGKFLFWKFNSLSEVSEYEKNRLVTYRSDTGLYTYELRYEFEPVESGTRLTEIGSANPRGLLKFAIRLLLGGADQNSARGLQLLKQVLEKA
jgi:hypothetical protein